MFRIICKKNDGQLIVKRDDRTGIAIVEDAETGSVHTPHPNISSTGSVRGMKKCLYWGKADVCVRAGRLVFNTSRHICSSEEDRIAAEYCDCAACQERRAAKKEDN